MEAAFSTDQFVAELARHHRVLLLGGMAIIAHGLSRPTKDSDIWLEPLASADDWASKLAALVATTPGAFFWSLAQRCVIEAGQVSEEADTFGMVRIGGLSLPLDVFRKPNELDPEEFERVWQQAKTMLDGVRLPNEVDLYITKTNTGREHDLKDQLFLESLLERRFTERLPLCDLDEAKALISRYQRPDLLAFALNNPNADVRNFALELLREFEAEGDPFSRDILAAWKEPA